MRIPSEVAARLRGPNFDIEEYLRYFPEITPAGKDYLRKAMQGPSRAVGGTANVTRHASTVFGQTYTTESDRELFIALMGDASEEVLWVTAQPPKVHLSYRAGDSNATAGTNPDGAMLTTRGVILCWATTSSHFRALCVEQPDRYKHDPKTGRFFSPPQQSAAKEYGFDALLVSEQSVPAPFVRNEQFLTFYKRRSLVNEVTPEEKAIVLNAVVEEPGIRATKIPISNKARLFDVICAMTVRREVFPNLLDAEVLKFDQLKVFPSPVCASAFTVFRGELSRAQPASVPLTRKFPINSSFRLGAATYTVRSHLPDAIRVVSDKTRRETDIAHSLLSDADIKTTISEADMAAEQLLAQLDERRLRQFIRNWKRISPYLPGGRLAGCSSGERHVRYLLRMYRIGGVRALVPREHERGNREPRKSELSRQLLEQAYKSNRNGINANAATTYNDYVNLADDHSLPKPDRYSKKSIERYIALRRGYITDKLTKGRRNAEKNRPPRGKKSVLGSPNGMSPWWIGHVDHTLMDCLVLNPETGEYERPWVSSLVDGFSGRILAAIMWFGHPNAVYVIELIKDCFSRHGTVPLKLRCDWGSEFRSTFVQAGLASIGISIAYRPKGAPRSGSVIETSFRNMNVKLLHQEPGNVTATKIPRGITEDIDPMSFATWNAEGFYSLMEKYIETHNAADRTRDVSPNEKYTKFIAAHGTHCAQWLSPELLDRLDYEPLRQSTRVVSRAATIRVLGEDYTAQELEELIGKDVRVYVHHKDPRTIHADHPQTKQRFTCKATSNAMVHCDTPEEACELRDLRQNSYQRECNADAEWAKLRRHSVSLRKMIKPRSAATRSRSSSTKPEAASTNQPEAAPTGQPAVRNNEVATLITN